MISVDRDLLQTLFTHQHTTTTQKHTNIDPDGESIVFQGGGDGANFFLSY